MSSIFVSSCINRFAPTDLFTSTSTERSPEEMVLNLVRKQNPVRPLFYLVLTFLLKLDHRVVSGASCKAISRCKGPYVSLAVTWLTWKRGAKA
jgi:hypothetical protein